MVKPFLKWAGGKSKLLWDIVANLPDYWYDGFSDYYEPFLGGGALALHLLDHPTFSKETKIHLSDANWVLVTVYQHIKENPLALLQQLNNLQKEIDTTSDLESLYYEIRTNFNKIIDKHIYMYTSFAIDFNHELDMVAYFMVLNKLGYNGLFRLNKKGQFNVPFGKKEVGTKIYNHDHILEVAEVLQNADIFHLNFMSILNAEECTPIPYETSFMYLDPPYRPIKPQSFSNYWNEGNWANDAFLDGFCDILKKLDDYGLHWLMSNSYSEDGYFQNQFSRPGFYLREVYAQRAINSKANGRSSVKELMIRNYPTPIADY